MIAPQIFTVHSQPQLLAKSFNPSEQQLQFGKNSLIQKYKISNGTQQLLFCKKINDGQQQFIMSINQKNIIQNERKKYIDFIKKNYNQKISEELFNINKLRQRVKEFQAKQLEDKHRQEELAAGKKTTKVLSEPQKRKTEDKKVVGGKKKLKTEKVNQQPVVAPKAKKNQAKKQAEKAPQLAQQAKKPQQAEEMEQIVSQSQSLDLDIINSFSQDYNEQE